MKKRSLIAATVSAAWLSFSSICLASAADSACPRQSLVGEWKLVMAEDLVGGQWVRSFGEEPKGYFSFSPGGWASVQFMKFPFDDEPTPGSFLAYFGRYTVDERACTFTVSIEGSINKSLVGSKAERSFRFEGAQVLHVGDGVKFRRKFQRMSQTALR